MVSRAVWKTWPSGLSNDKNLGLRPRFLSTESLGPCFSHGMGNHDQILHHSPRNFIYSTTGRNVSPILIAGSLWTVDRGAAKCMTLHLWVKKLKPFPVANYHMVFTACCTCLSMVFRDRHPNRSPRSALKMSLVIREGNSLIFSPDL